MKTRVVVYIKLLVAIIICCSLSFSAQAEYYLVTGGSPNVVWLSGHHRCYHRHYVRRHYPRYHYVRRSPRIQEFLVWRQLSCGGCCGMSCPGFNVYYAQPVVDNDIYSWDSYNPDVATADDNTWSHPDLQQSVDDYVTYSY